MSRASSPRVLIDGRSGSGKTELAAAMSATWPEAQVVHLDDIYPGWGGLEVASRYTYVNILDSDHPRWQRWDWAAGEYREWHELDPLRPILIEGCGALSRANRQLATFGVWVELGATERKRRAIRREPDFADHWDAWARQERAFIRREHPQSLADALVDGRNALASGPLLGERARVDFRR